MARRREVDSDDAASDGWSRTVAEYCARLHGLGPQDDPIGRAVAALSDAELLALARRHPENPGSSKVIEYLGSAHSDRSTE